LSWETDVAKAVKDADYVYTDTWVDMEFFNDPNFKKEKEERIALMMPFQVNAELLKKTKAKMVPSLIR
jgi:ornithine carbamoyltransferase